MPTEPPAPPSAEPDDDQALRARADALAEAVEAVLAAWVVRCVERLMIAWRGDSALERRVREDAAEAGGRAAVEVGSELRKVLAQDIDEQRTSPLSILRRAVRYPTDVLGRAGVPSVVRDEFAERAFPDDVYGLAPVTFADVDPSLHDHGMAWGAAKAHVHLTRRRQEGRR